MKDLGDLLAWTPDSGTYTCRTCGALVALGMAYAHARFHARTDPPPDATENPTDLPATGPEDTGP